MEVPERQTSLGARRHSSSVYRRQDEPLVANSKQRHESAIHLHFLPLVRFAVVAGFRASELPPQYTPGRKIIRELLFFYERLTLTVPPLLAHEGEFVCRCICSRLDASLLALAIAFRLDG